MERDSQSNSEPRKWMLAPHRRARSAELNQGERPPNIPENEESPSSTPSQQSPEVMVSPSSTPPKKTWERHYRSFLTKRDTTDIPAPGPPPDHSHLAASRPNGGSRSKFSLVPGSKRLLVQRQASDNPQSQVTMPALTTLSKTKSSGDMTVKGGNFFSHVFHNKSPGSSTTRKTKSMDALDSSLRRGQEKTYSPKASHRTNEHEMGPGPMAPLIPSGTVNPLPKGNPPPLHPKSPQSQKRLSSNLAKALASPESEEPAVLPLGLAASAKTSASTEIKKAFTEFHNSPAFAKDSTSAFLGDDTSAYGNTHFAMYNQMAMHYKDSMGHPERVMARSSLPNQPISKSLDPVSDEIFINKSQRMLKPVAGPDTWTSGRRYLIAPAVLATCPIQVLPTLSGSKTIRNFDDDIFGILELGDATMSYVGKRKASSGWSACTLILRQNYLLEYERDAGIMGRPRGFAHLQHAKAYPHQDFLNALELEFFGSPCAKSDKRKLLIRVEHTIDRDRWVACLNSAAKLSIHDLYDFDSNSFLGQGRYASVYKARRKGTDEGSPECAIKVVDKTEFWSRVVKNMERADTLVREAAVQATLTCKGVTLPTILKLSSLFETCDSIVIEVELLDGTDLFRYVSSKNVLGETEAASIVRDILVCLEAMCRFGVAHRDVKPANILMCDKEKHGVHVKVADFGMSTFVGVDGQLRGRCGTPGFVAPEIFSAGINGGYGNKVDVFSAGVTLYIMLCGYEPFYGESDAELINANKEAHVEFPGADWDNGKCIPGAKYHFATADISQMLNAVSVEARDLVQKMLERDPTKRISAKEALQHPWIASHTASGSRPVDSMTKNFHAGAACIIS